MVGGEEGLRGRGLDVPAGGNPASLAKIICNSLRIALIWIFLKKW